jgi:hypothetical protein
MTPTPTVAWSDQLAACCRTIERRWLDKTLAGAAIVSARSNDAKHEYVQHYRNVSGFLAYFETVCVISHAEALEMRRAWVRTEAELRLYRLPPGQRRAQLLDPSDGPQRFLTLERRRRMLREIERAQ